MAGPTGVSGVTQSRALLRAKSRMSPAEDTTSVAKMTRATKVRCWQG